MDIAFERKYRLQGLNRVTAWRALACPSDFPFDVQAVVCSGNSGNHQIHHRRSSSKDSIEFVKKKRRRK